MTLTEAKAQAYDTLANIEQLQRQLQGLNKAIVAASTQQSPAPEAPVETPADPATTATADAAPTTA